MELTLKNNINQNGSRIESKQMRALETIQFQKYMREKKNLRSKSIKSALKRFKVTQETKLEPKDRHWGKADSSSKLKRILLAIRAIINGRNVLLW